VTPRPHHPGKAMGVWKCWVFGHLSEGPCPGCGICRNCGRFLQHSKGVRVWIRRKDRATPLPAAHIGQVPDNPPPAYEWPAQGVADALEDIDIATWPK
jgi:hypothetical protein